MTATAKKQQEIPGTEDKVVAELEEIAAPLCEVRYQRMELQEQENALAQQLLDRMQALSMDHYRRRDGETVFNIRVDQKSKVKIERKVEE